MGLIWSLVFLPATLVGMLCFLIIEGLASTKRLLGYFFLYPLIWWIAFLLSSNRLPDGISWRGQTSLGLTVSLADLITITAISILARLISRDGKGIAKTYVYTLVCLILIGAVSVAIRMDLKMLPMEVFYR